MNKRERSGLIRASALGEYVFCARAWWLRVEGFEPTRGARAREAGRRWHEGHGRRVARAKRLRALASACAYLAVAVAVLILLVWWRG
jgi:CRISPR/Cas system-associated exonuclease Cas4 (RecB family)